MEPEFKIIHAAADEPTILRAQEFVGGPVEGLEMPNGDYLLVNHEAFEMALAVNLAATAYVNGFREHVNKDLVQGPALLVKRKARQKVFTLSHPGAITA